jgi:hypothetical protein
MKLFPDKSQTCLGYLQPRPRSVDGMMSFHLLTEKHYFAFHSIHACSPWSHAGMEKTTWERNEQCHCDHADKTSMCCENEMSKCLCMQERNCEGPQGDLKSWCKVHDQQIRRIRAPMRIWESHRDYQCERTEGLAMSQPLDVKMIRRVAWPDPATEHVEIMSPLISQYR